MFSVVAMVVSWGWMAGWLTEYVVTATAMQAARIGI
jgi:hypothetical protein